MCISDDCDDVVCITVTARNSENRYPFDQDGEFPSRPGSRPFLEYWWKNQVNGAKATVNYLKNCASGASSVTADDIRSAAQEGAQKGSATGPVKGAVQGAPLGGAGAARGALKGLLTGPPMGAAKGAVTGFIEAACGNGN